MPRRGRCAGGPNAFSGCSPLRGRRPLNPSCLKQGGPANPIHFSGCLNHPLRSLLPHSLAFRAIGAYNTLDPAITQGSISQEISWKTGTRRAWRPPRTGSRPSGEPPRRCGGGAPHARAPARSLKANRADRPRRRRSTPSSGGVNGVNGGGGAATPPGSRRMSSAHASANPRRPSKGEPGSGCGAKRVSRHTLRVARAEETIRSCWGTEPAKRALDPGG